MLSIGDGKHIHKDMALCQDAKKRLIKDCVFYGISPLPHRSFNISAGYWCSDLYNMCSEMMCVFNTAFRTSKVEFCFLPLSRFHRPQHNC